MSFRINTNVQSMAAQRSLNRIKLTQDKSYERLSSGERIVRAGDDAAGLAISEKIKSQIRSHQQAERNSGDGISMIQVAEGGLNEISSILIRIRELSIQAGTDTLENREREITDLEVGSLVDEIDRIAHSTIYNGKTLINGQGENVDLQVGTYNKENVDRLHYSPASTNATKESLGLDGMNVKVKEEAHSNLDKLDLAMDMVNSSRAQLGALSNRLSSTVNNLQNQIENLSAANSRIRDTDVASETAELAKSNILTTSGVSILAQANTSSNAVIRLVS